MAPLLKSGCSRKLFISVSSTFPFPVLLLRIVRHEIEALGDKMTIHGMFKRIVRNDAIRVDPPEIYNWRVIALTASVSRSYQTFTALLY